VTYTHEKIQLNDGDTIVIDSSHNCHACLLRDKAYELFLRRKTFKYEYRSDTAMYALNLPKAKLHVSRGGFWHMLLIFTAKEHGVVRYLTQRRLLRAFLFFMNICKNN
jgi:hypothetical protein